MGDIPIKQNTGDVTLYDEAGNPVAVQLIDGIYRLAVNSRSTKYPFPGVNSNAFVANGGSIDMNVDGSITPVSFTAQPPTGKLWYIHTIDIVIEDTGMNFSKFGGLSALTNGVEIKAKKDGLAEVLLVTINRNGDFYTFANDAFIESSTTDILVAHVRTEINTGTTFKISDANSEFFKVVINDDLTSLDKFQILIRGYEVDE